MITKELTSFIEWYSIEKKISIDLNSLQPNTDVINDLRIDDLDLDVFIAEFIRKFNIDDSFFERRLYFGVGISLIDNNIVAIKKIVGNRNWLPLEKDKRKPFTLDVLEKAINTKKLI